MDLLFGLVGLTILLLAGDALVRGSVALAQRLGIPQLVVSLTIVSFGTSAPELFISVNAVLDGAPGIAIGNVLGSNTANILLVLGLPALIAGLDTHSLDTRPSYLTMLSVTALFTAIAWFQPISWIHGLILLSVLALVLLDQAGSAKSQMTTNHLPPIDEPLDPEIRYRRIVPFLLFGLIGLPVGAKLFVDSAVVVATQIGVSQTVIGLTLVAIGTSIGGR